LAGAARQMVAGEFTPPKLALYQFDSRRPLSAGILRPLTRILH